MSCQGWGCDPVPQLCSTQAQDWKIQAGLRLGQAGAPGWEGAGGCPSSVSPTPPTSSVCPCPAGLTEPTLIRLDVESKLSEQLKVSLSRALCSGWGAGRVLRGVPKSVGPQKG